MSLTPAKQRFVDLASAKHGKSAVLNKEEVREVVLENEKQRRRCMVVKIEHLWNSDYTFYQREKE